MFEVGDKVVCIYNKFHTKTISEGGVYTIKNIFGGMVELNEIPNRHLSLRFAKFGSLKWLTHMAIYGSGGDKDKEVN